MKKTIVTTTINEPTAAILKFCEKEDWNFIIVGDLKTPHNSYEKLEKKYSHVQYLRPGYQEKKYKKLSDAIGWNCIQRRNIGFVEAYNSGAEIIASVDDDNIPYDFWGKNLLVGRERKVDMYESEAEVFDPLSITKNNHIWHRGYPIELLAERFKVVYKGKVKRKVLVQADLWDGDPDIDAMARLLFKPMVKYPEIKVPYCSNRISPFNSQNTFLSREVLPHYAVLPHVGRSDDVWGSYILQYYFPNSVVYNRATVYQDRNAHDLIDNLEKEILGYRRTLYLIKNISSFERIIPPAAAEFYRIYTKYYT